MATLDDLFAKKEAEFANVPQGPGAEPSSPSPPSLEMSGPTAAPSLDQLFAQKEAELAKQPAPSPSIASRVGEAVSGANQRVDQYNRQAMPTGTNSVQELAQGANYGIANLTGLPFEAVNALLNYAGEKVAGKPIGFLDKPGNAQAIAREALRKVGFSVPDKELDSYAFKIGEMLPSILLGTGGLLAASGRLAAASIPGMPGFSGAVRAIGSAAQEAPGLLAASDIAAAPGAVVGGDLAKRGTEALIGPGKTAETAGAIGSLLGGSLTGGVLAMMATKARTPMRERLVKEGDLGAIANYADNAIRRETDAMDRSIRQTVESAAGMPPSNSRLAVPPEQTYRSWFQRWTGLDAAWRGRERTLYESAPRVEHDVTDLHQTMMTMLRSNAGGNPANIPEEPIRLMRQLVERPSPPGTILLDTVNTQELMRWRSWLLSLRREAGGNRLTGTAPNETLQRNLDILQARVLDVIDQRLGQNPDWQMAREFSRAYHDRFTRGPLALLAEATKRGEYVRNPREMFTQLLEDPNALPALHEASGAVLDNSGRRLLMPPSITGSRVRAATDEAIRQRYQEVITQAGLEAEKTPGPGRFEQAAAKSSQGFMLEHGRAIEDFSRASTQLQTANMHLADTLAAKAAWADNQLTRFTRVSPESAINWQLHAPNKDRVARQFLDDIQRTATSDPLGAQRAQAAWEYGVVKRYLTDGTRSPTLKLKELQTPEWQRFFDVVLGPERRQQMAQIVDGMARFESGETNFGTNRRVSAAVAAKGVPWLAQITGLHLGAKMVKVLFSSTGRGPASLSLPAKMSRAMQEMAANALRQETATDLITQAIVDPKSANLLLREVPGTPEAAMAAARRTIMWSRRVNLATDHMVNQSFAEDRKREADGAKSFLERFGLVK